jgi:hypothetical protein
MLVLLSIAQYHHQFSLPLTVTRLVYAVLQTKRTSNSAVLSALQQRGTVSPPTVRYCQPSNSAVLSALQQRGTVSPPTGLLTVSPPTGLLTVSPPTGLLNLYLVAGNFSKTRSACQQHSTQRTAQNTNTDTIIIASALFFRVS